MITLITHLNFFSEVSDSTHIQMNINPVMEGVIGGEEVDPGKCMRRQRWWTDNFLRQIGRYHKTCEIFLC